MKAATEEVKHLVSFSADSLVLSIYLSQEPIGDEDSYLTEDECERAAAYIRILEKIGIKVWKEQDEALQHD